MLLTTMLVMILNSYTNHSHYTILMFSLHQCIVWEATSSMRKLSIETDCALKYFRLPLHIPLGLQHVSSSIPDRESFQMFTYCGSA